MAFNPFSGFRKHAKVMIAILAVLCMVMFVLAGNFQGADALDWFVRKVGGGLRQGDVVARLYGNKVYQGELERLTSDRQLANDFVRRAVESDLTQAVNEAYTQLLRPAPSDQPAELAEFRDQAARAVIAYLVAAGASLQPSQQQGAAEWAASQRLNALVMPQTDERKEGDAVRNRHGYLSQYFAVAQERSKGSRAWTDFLFQQRNALRALSKRLETAGHEDEAKLAKALGLHQAYLAWLISQPQGTPELIFGGTTRRQDLLDFLVWKHQADTLGIRLVESDIRALVNRMTPLQGVLTGKKAEDQQKVRELFGERKGGVDLSGLYKALGEELRVSLAQAAILGDAAGFRGAMQSAFEAPAGVTPARYLDYYRDQRTTLKVALLPVPVESFLSDKLPAPGVRELEEFFERYKNEEPNPASSTPGFRIPHRARFAWLAVPDRSRLDRQIWEGVDKVDLQEAARAIPGAGYLRGLTDPRRQDYLRLADRTLKGSAAMLHHNPLNALADAWHLAHLYSAYNEVKGPFVLPPLLGDPRLAYYTALNLPTAHAGVAGLLAGGDQAAYFSALVSSQAAHAARARQYQDEYVKRDLQQRARVIGSLTLSSIGPAHSSLGSALTRPVPWLWANGKRNLLDTLQPDTVPDDPVVAAYVPLGALSYQVLDQAQSMLAASLLSEDLRRLQKQLEEAKDDAAKVAEVIEAARKRHWWWDKYYGQAAEAVDRYGFLASPELRALRSALEESFPELKPEQKLQFAEAFIKGQGELYRPMPLGDRLLVWKTENLPGRTPRFSEVRDEVLRAWRMREARKRARSEAERLRELVAGKKPAEALKVLREAAEKHPTWGNVIRLDGVTQQVPVPATLPDRPRLYDPYKVPEHEIPYPPANFVRELVRLDEKEAGLIEDRPGRHIYVAYVEDRSQPEPIEKVLAERTRNVREILWDTLAAEQKEQLRDALVKELRRQAGELNARGRFRLEPGVKPDDERPLGGSDE